MESELEVAAGKLEISEVHCKSPTADVDMIHAEDTRIETERKVAAPGKMLVKVKKTRTFIDKDGYMVNEDYDSLEETDYVEPVKKVAAKIEKRAPASN